MKRVNKGVMTALHTIKPYTRHHHERVKEEEEDKTSLLQESMQTVAAKMPYISESPTEIIIKLQQDVDKLNKKLQFEENIHRVLEKVLTTPLSAFPRPPPYLPPHTSQLLADIAELEEEVVRLEEQAVSIRHELHKEATYMSSSKKSMDNESANPQSIPDANKAEDSRPSSQCTSPRTSIPENRKMSLGQLLSFSDNGETSSDQIADVKRPLEKPHPELLLPRDRHVEDNHLSPKSKKKGKPPRQRKQHSRVRTSGTMEKHTQVNMKECKATDRERAEGNSQSTTDVAAMDESGSPNKISENILNCLLSIFFRMSSSEKIVTDWEVVPSVVGSSLKSTNDGAFGDPYGICPVFGTRDIGPYKHFHSLDQNSIDPDFVPSSSTLFHRLKILLRKLAFVDFRGLTHQQKLAFWINIYNSCMMNAFLELGISAASPQKVVELVQKARVNVGGHLLTAMSIEHFILRLPYHPRDALPKSLKEDEKITWSISAVDQPEPLVAFALSCGSWSSPAVRVYTASKIGAELERAKRDYLEAAVGISPANKLVIPKLLDWYLNDYAKDVESIVAWICLQHPNSRLRNEAIECIEREKRGEDLSQVIQVLPYEFSFRYILVR